MVSFVEKAVLVVEDQSTPTIRKINAELDKLLAKARRLNGSSVKAVSKAFADLGAKTRHVRRGFDDIGRSDALVKTRDRTRRARDEMRSFSDETKKAEKALRDLSIRPQIVRHVRQMRDDTQATAKAAEQAAKARARFLDTIGRSTRTQSAEQAEAREAARLIARALADGAAAASRQNVQAGQQAGQQIGQQAGQSAAQALAQAGQQAGQQIGQSAAQSFLQATERRQSVPGSGSTVTRGVDVNVDPLGGYIPPLIPSDPGRQISSIPPPRASAAATGAIAGTIAASEIRRAQEDTARIVSDAHLAAMERAGRLLAVDTPEAKRKALQQLSQEIKQEDRAKKLDNAKLNLAQATKKEETALAELARARQRLSDTVAAERAAYQNYTHQRGANDRLERQYKADYEAARKESERAQRSYDLAQNRAIKARDRVAKRYLQLQSRATINAAATAKLGDRKPSSLASPSGGGQGASAGPEPLRPVHPAGGGGAGIPPGGSGGSGVGKGDGKHDRESWRAPTVREAMRHMAPYYAASSILSAGRNTLQTAGEGIIYAQNQRELTSIQGLSPEKRRTIEQATDTLGSEFRQLSRAELMEMTRDAINASKTAEDGAKIARAMAQNAANLTLLYGSSEKGMEAARQFYRAADISGDSDSAESATIFMRALTKETLRSGKDINARSVAQAIANLGTAKFGMNEDSIAGIVALSDNVRGQTSAYIRQFHEYFTSNSIKDENRAAQIAAGLRDSVTGGVIDATLFNEDKFEWVMKHIKPLVERKIGRKLDSIATDAERAALIDKALADSGLKPSAIKLPSEFLMNEARERRRRADYKNVTLDGANTLADRNIQLAGIAIKRKFQDVADYWTSKMQGQVAAAGGAISSALNWLVPWSKSRADGSSPGSEQRGSLDSTKLALGTAALGAGLIARYVIEHPEKASMLAAAAGLGAAGASLNAAAAALTGAAAAQRAAGVAGGLAGGAGAAAAVGSAIGRAASLALRAGVLGVGVAVAADIIGAIRSGTKDDERKPGKDAHRLIDGTKSTVPHVSDRPSDYARRLEGSGFTARERRDAYRELLEMDIGGYNRAGQFVDGELMRQRARLNRPLADADGFAGPADRADAGASIGAAVQAVAPTLSGAVVDGGNQVAPTLTQALINGASQAAETIAAAMRAAVQNISVTVTGGVPSNTGTNPQAQR